jgi:transposase-like protein
MGKDIRKRQVAGEPERSTLGELIHAAVRRAIEAAVVEELAGALGADRYEREAARRGYRNGTKERTLTGPTGPVPLTLPRATVTTPAGRKEWVSTLVPRYQRRLPEVNAAVLAIYLAGGNTRRLRGALGPLLHGAPLSRSAVSRIVATLKGSLDAWLTQPLADREVVYAYLDALMLRVRSAGKVVSAPVLAVVGVLADGQKVLLTLELCSGGESYEAWKGCLDGLGARGLTAPLLAIIDGHAGLRRAVAEGWPRAAVQRCCVHKLRNMERKAPKHALAEVREDFHEIVYAASADAARTAWAKFERTWGTRCPGVVKSLQEGGAELLTFFSFPKTQWKTLRTTNVIERLNEEFRRRVKTQGALPTEDSALILLFGLVATGQITLRKLDGYKQLAAIISERMRPAA